MSTSCVRRSVVTVSFLGTAGYPTRPCRSPRRPPNASSTASATPADRFIAELDQEYYDHYAGLKEGFDLVPIYERHAELTTLETAQKVGVAVDGDRRARELWKFTCEGYMGNVTREYEEKQARIEAELKATVDGEEIPFRMLRPTIANTAERDKREQLERIRNELTEEHLNPVLLEASTETRRAVHELGASSYLELYRDRFGMKLEELAEQCRGVLASTEQIWETWGDRLFRDRVGVGLAEAQRFDVPRLFRAPVWDPQFPADRMLPALEGTLADLGIDLEAQENVHLDVEQRPLKTPRAFCAPIEIPDKVMLVIQPQGGPDDWRALFHEAGHTEHFAFTSRDLSVEERRLGDNAVTEGWAMLLQHLTDEPAWLTRRLDFPRPDEFAKEGAVGLLYFVRRYCAKILYELEFHAADDPTTMRDRYVEILGDALKINPSPDGLPRRHRRGLLRLLVPALVGVRVAAPRAPAQRVRQRLVRPARGRLAAPRAVVARPEADGGGAARGRDRRDARDGSGRGPDPRDAPGLGLCEGGLGDGAGVRARRVPVQDGRGDGDARDERPHHGVAPGGADAEADRRRERVSDPGRGGRDADVEAERTGRRQPRHDHLRRRRPQHLADDADGDDRGDDRQRRRDRQREEREPGQEHRERELRRERDPARPARDPQLQEDDEHRVQREQQAPAARARARASASARPGGASRTR